MLNSVRNQGIDVLRGLSIFLVVLHHCYIHMPLQKEIIPKIIINVIFFSGYYGVIIFFVISGFLITQMSLHRWNNLKNISLSEFYKMRIARIMPCLVLLLTVLSLFSITHVPGFEIKTTTLTNALFSAFTFQINWLEAETGYLPANWDVLWSLSIEEVFYLFFPVVCILARKTTLLFLCLFAFVIVGPFSRTILSSNELWLDYSYVSGMDGIAIGVIAAIITQSYNFSRTSQKIIFILGLAITCIITVFKSVVYDVGLNKLGLNVSVLQIGIAMILVSLTDNTSQRRMFAPLGRLGRYSYEIYLTHSFFVVGVSKLLFQETQILYTFFLYLIVILMSVLTGYVISNYFSEPINRRLRRVRF